MKVLPAGSTPKGTKAIVTAICLVFMGAGGVFGFLAYRGIQEARQSQQWPTTPGRIVRSGVSVSVHQDRTHRDRRNRESRSYSADVGYEFTVNNRKVHGSRITVVSDQFGSQGWAEATVAKFPVGREVTVSYNPRNPEQCVLEPGSWGGATWMLVAAGVFGILPPIVLKAIWAKSPRPTELHAETRPQRRLHGLEFRERILAWNPGRHVHLKRDATSLFAIIGGSLIGGLVLGLIFGLAPALFLFSAKGPLFIGQFYLAVSLIAACIAFGWLWWDSRPRETHIDWETQRVRMTLGGKVRDVALNELTQLSVTTSSPPKSDPGASRDSSWTMTSRINAYVQGEAFVVLECEFPPDDLPSVSKKLAETARELATSLEVPVNC